MANEWKEYSIDDLKAESKNAIAMGPFGSRIKAENFVDFGVPVIKGGNLNGDFLNEDEYSYLTEEKAEELKTSNAFRKDIVITHRGTIGQVGIIPDNSAYERYIVSQSQLKITLNKSVINPYFVYYFLRSPIGQYRLLQNASQVGVPAIARASSSVKKITISVPKLNEQDFIVHILKSLDDKIELNRQMNQTLEQMAQAMFKSWFVDFDPVIDNALAQGNEIPEELQQRAEQRHALGDERKPLPDHIQKLFPTEFEFSDELDKWIPKGWRAIPLYNVAEFINGAAFKHDDFVESGIGLPIIKIAELKSGIDTQTKYTAKQIDQKYFITTGDMLYSWSGSPETSLEVFKWHGADGLLNQHIFKVNTISKSREVFVFYLLKHLKPQLVGIAKDKQTTGLGHVTVKDMQKLFVVLPENEDEIMKCFKDFYNKCSASENETEYLKKLREILLPILITGEVRVENLESRI